jgi:predicted ATPase/class 3 adenylate cyclase
MSEAVAQWLVEIGLEQYVSNFADNDIDVNLLPALTANDLREIGVKSLGHRKKILDAIEKRNDAKLKPVSTDEITGEVERRQLTVMFCDLADSTKLSQLLDPEDLRSINLAYQDACKCNIEKFGGYIARYMGDGVLAYFGFPRAHEDDAERAVRAGLCIASEIPNLDSNVDNVDEITLGVRIGIETGTVVVGDLIGEAASQESAVVGETPNLAARLQSIAARNSLVIGPGTEELVKSRFEFKSLGDQNFKGVQCPVRVWQVTGEVEAESRFELARQSGLTPLVGREHEIGLIRERWNQASEGDGQVVLLSGEAGIGKSRISETLLEGLSGSEFSSLRFQCSPHHINSALYPVIEQFNRTAKISPENSPDEKYAHLEAWLAPLIPDDYQALALLAQLLSIPSDEHGGSPTTSPERKKELTLETLTAVLERLSLQNTVLLIFEDVHWADPSSLEWLDIVVGKLQQIRVLAIITFRPEFSSRWDSHTHITSLTLNRFSRSLASAMVDGISAGRPLPEEIKQHIIDKTDGMPLFVEELTKNILESDQLMSNDALSNLAVPTTLQDSLMARLDRLPQGKTVAQVGAAIGRVFSRELLDIVSGLDSIELDEALDELIDSGLVFGRGEIFTFKHTLVQEAAYASLLKSRQRDLHAQIAEALRTRFTDLTESQPELIAQHFEAANQHQTALEYWLLAGRRARERSADQEAVGHFTAGIRTLRSLPDPDANAQLELDFLLDLCGPAIVTTGWGSQLSAETYTRARELCSLLGGTRNIYPVLYGEYMLELTRGRFDRTHEKAKELLKLGGENQDVEAIIAGHRTVGWSSLYLGNFTFARSHLEKIQKLYRLEEHGQHKYRYAHDPHVSALCALSILEAIFGELEQSARTAKEAIEFARKIDHASTIIYSLVFAGALPSIIMRDVQNTQSCAEEILQLSNQIRSDVWLGFCKVVSGWCQGLEQNHEEGVALIESGLKMLDGSAPHPWRPLFLVMLAEINLRHADPERALVPLKTAVQMIDHTGERMWEAGVHLLLGETILQQNPDDTKEAEERLTHAMDTAALQSANLLELRAATSLARILQNQCKLDEARELLKPIYDRFTEGADSLDLHEAAELLEQLQ